jgi:lipopolysaccharide transport system ATP-binding protein
MSDTAIEVKGLGKRYEIAGDEGGYLLLTERITERVRNLGRRTKPQEFWALRDIDFEVPRGGTLGVIGHNGAGKSTLLKILARITPPTTGEARLRGRVGALLEVGTGFHPELTGRENIFLNGAILNMGRREIQQKFEEIVEFADIGPFIDTPVKRYSSGMQLRLAFSVAAHLEPEILIVDEVLSVGDLAFQEKCLGRMEEATSEGRTVVFISHNLSAVRNLCDKAIMLNGGRIEEYGPTDQVVNSYIGKASVDATRDLRERRDRSGNGELLFTGVRFEHEGRDVDSVVSGGSFDIVVSYETTTATAPRRVNFGISLAPQGEPQALISFYTETEGTMFDRIPERGLIRCSVPRCPLPAGQYRVSVGADDGVHSLDMVERATDMTVQGGDFFGSGRELPEGHHAVLVDHTWSLEPLADGSDSSAQATARAAEAQSR